MKDFTITHIGHTELSLPMPFIFIPAKGKTFMFQADDGSSLGSKNEGSHITFENDFWMCAYQTTQEFWERVVITSGHESLKAFPSHFVGKTRPVERVNWHDIFKFNGTLNQLFIEDLLTFKNPPESGGNFGLPTEVEWEYTANAEQGLLYSGSQNLDDVGWYKQNSNEQTMPVGMKQPNRWGLFDMSGNVWEWCHIENKKFDSNAKVILENIESSSAIRGGSCLYFPQRSNIRFLDHVSPGSRYENGGFRLCFTY